MIHKVCRLIAYTTFIGVAFLNLALTNKDKAVYETSEKDGFKVSEIGLKNLAVGVKDLDQKPPYRLPATALVFLKDKVGVYRKRQDWFKLIFVNYQRVGSTETVVRSEELAAGDSVVIKGAALLRVAESDAFGGEE